MIEPAKPASAHHFSRGPQPALGCAITRIWATRPAGAPFAGAADKEIVLPATQMHIVVRLDNRAVRIRSFQDEATMFRAGAVAGLRTAAYAKEMTRSCPTVGAMVRPGMCAALLGVPSSEFAGSHVELADVWQPARLDRLRDQLASAATAEEMVAIFEKSLLAGRPLESAPSSLVAGTLFGLGRHMTLGDIAAASGRSHRHLVHRFREEVGVAPKQFARLLRFERLIQMLREPVASLADVAAWAGFADQAHMAREFRSFTDMTISQYAARVGDQPRHVSWAAQPVKNIQDRIPRAL
jgi:AraC-like DNA-binding protein